MFFVRFLPPHRSPNGPGLVEWPRYNHENYPKLNLQPAVGRGLKQNRAHFLDVVLPDKAKSEPANDELWLETSIKCNIHYYTKSEEATEFHCLLSTSLYLHVVLADWADLPVWMFDSICAGTFKYRLWWPSPRHLEKQRQYVNVFMPSFYNSFSEHGRLWAHKLHMICCTWGLRTRSSLWTFRNLFSSSRYFSFSFSLSLRSFKKSSLKTSA